MIELTKEGDLWIVSLNRPNKANSLTLQMLEDLISIVEKAQGIRVLVLTGVGKVFSAGADLEEIKTTDLATADVWERLSQAIADFSGLTIAALNGTLAGGACGMALACDIRIAVPMAKVFYPVMKLGYLPQPSDPARLTALVGPARAKLVLMAGQKLSTEESYQFGLFDRIVEPEDLLQTARELSADVLAARPEIVAGIKDLCQRRIS
ncbi:MAG: enoyl-CoA hydratase/isomerase family protein [Pseudoruegeria sp.]